MKILITGNMGYIGPCVVSHLRSCYPEAELIGLDLGYFAGCLTNAGIFPECRVNTQHFLDVRGIPPYLLKDIDAIVHLLNDFVAGAVSSKQITILSDGTPWRPLIDVKDMALAIEWAISREASAGGNFLAVNIGSDTWNYQVRDLAEAVADVISGVKISINKDSQPDKRSYRVNFDLFKKLAPEHQPRVDLISSIKELKAGLEAMNFDNTNFRESNLMRLKVLKDLREKKKLNEKLGWEDI